MLGATISGNLLKLFAVIGIALVVWLAQTIWTSLANIEESQAEFRNQLEKLESDEAKWAAMADMRNDVLRLQADLEIMRRVWEYEYGREVPAARPVEKAPEIKKEDIEEFLEQRTLEAEEFRRQAEQRVLPRSKK